MAKSLSPETETRMRSLCREISVAHELDPEIQKELYGHMEDKALAYLNAEEPLTEEDVLILVREHFGDPAALKGLLQDVHLYATRVSFARRLAAVVTLNTLGVLLAQSFFAAVSLPGLYSGSPWAIWSFLAREGVAYPGVLLLWAILYYWQRRLDAGKPVWFTTWRSLSVVGVPAVLLVLVWSSTVYRTSFPQTSVGVLPAIQDVRLFPLLALLILGAGLIAFVAQCMVWVWWCDRPPRLRRAVIKALGAWLAFNLILWTSGFPKVFVLLAERGSKRFGAALAASFGMTLAVGAVCALLAALVYVFGRYVLARRNRRRVQVTR